MYVSRIAEEAAAAAVLAAAVVTTCIYFSRAMIYIRTFLKQMCIFRGIDLKLGNRNGVTRSHIVPVAFVVRHSRNCDKQNRKLSVAATKQKYTIVVRFSFSHFSFLFVLPVNKNSTRRGHAYVTVAL